MKYWLLTTEFPPLSGGGISTYCLHTAHMLHDYGHDVTVIICDDSVSKETLQDGYPFRCLRIPLETGHSSYLGNETAWSLSLSNALDKLANQLGSPDIIEAQEYNGIAYISLQKKLLLNEQFSGSKFIVTAHAPSFLYLEYNQGPTHEIPYFWTGEMEKSVLVSADAVISPSTFLLEKLDEYMEWSNQKKVAIKNPYRFEEGAVPDYNEGEFVFFGKLTPQKGCMEMLHYFSKIWDDGLTCKLKIIGGGDHFFYPKMATMGSFLEAKYAKYIESGLLKFVGHINPENLDKHLKSAHAILVPSIVDNLPYTVVESMATGKIVLASSAGGQKELIHDGQDGFVFNHDEHGAVFSDKIKAILSLSPAEIRSMGQAAIDKIKSVCGYETVYAQKMSFINEVSSTCPSEFPFTRVKPEMVPHSGTSDSLLSVVIPFYNLGEFVDDAIKSILNSDYRNLEIIVVNDGSDPSNTAVLEKYSATENIKVHHIPNGGLSNARNYGAEQASGEFLAFLDADDIADPTYYPKAIDIMNRFHNVSFVGCWAEYFQDSKISWPAFNPEPPYLLVHNMVNSSGLVYRKSAFLKYGKNDPSFIYGMEDYDSVINLVTHGCGGVAIPEKLWRYRIRKESMAQAFNNYSKQFLYRKVAAKYKAAYSEYAHEIANLLNANGPGYLIENPTRVTRKELKYLHPGLVKFLKQNKLLRPIALKVYSYLNN